MNSTQLGRYELLGELGHGGMATVYRARVAGPMGFQKTLVVKCILPHLASESQFVEMFLSEAKLAAQLNHPNLVQIFDFGEADGTYFLAMEYIDGPNLRAVMKRAFALGRPLPLPLCARIVSAVCEGLAYAHEFVEPSTGEPLNLVHRDISPDNILLARTGAVKVVDFGIAKATNQVHQTQVGTLKGKVPYMAPEQIRNEPVDMRIDIYALGVVLYELVAGRKPFEASSEVALINAILHHPFTPLAARRPDVPEPLLRIVERALAKDRAVRYASCREFQADLDAFVLGCGQSVGAFQLAEFVAQLSAASGSQVPAAAPAVGSSGARRVPTGPVSRPGPMMPPPPPPEATIAELQPPSRVMEAPSQGAVQLPSRPRWVMPTVAASVLLLAGGVGVLALSGRSEAPPAPAPISAPVVAPVPVPAAAPPPATALVAPPAPPVEAAARTEEQAPQRVEEHAPVPEDIELSLRVVPGGARVELDGRALSGNPFSGRFTRDGETHVLRVSATGFEPLVKELRFETDVMLELSLQRRGADVRRTRASRSRGSTSAAQATAAPDASADGISELPMKAPAGGSKNRRSLDADSPWDDKKRDLDGDDPWNSSRRKLDSANPWKE